MQWIHTRQQPHTQTQVPPPLTPTYHVVLHDVVVDPPRALHELQRPSVGPGRAAPEVGGVDVDLCSEGEVCVGEGGRKGTVYMCVNRGQDIGI